MVKRSLRKLMAGDRIAAEVLLDRFAPRVKQLAQRLLGWRGDVEDVVQEVFVAALDGRESFRGSSNVETWLTRIAVNKCRAHLRKAWVRRRLFQAWAERQTERAVTPADRQAIADEEPI